MNSTPNLTCSSTARHVEVKFLQLNFHPLFPLASFIDPLVITCALHPSTLHERKGVASLKRSYSWRP